MTLCGNPRQVLPVKARTESIALWIAYDGTDFAGFQRQAAEHGPTVQGAIEAAIRAVAGEEVTIVAAGRTDSGVHATGQVVSFRSDARLTARAWGRALNAHLPRSVAVRAAAPVAAEFHARYSALARSYRYQILWDPAPAPLAERYALRVARRPDVAAMDLAAVVLRGEHDFAAFGSSPRDQRRDGVRGHCVRVLSEARCRWVGRRGGFADTTAEAIAVASPGAASTESTSTESTSTETAAGTSIWCEFTANAFLTGMVRRMVGTLLLVGAGRLTAAGLAAILEARAKTHPGAAVAARGLCLVGVTYPAGAVEWESVG
jgi:tRNA pseudouridine38-40 synthase